MEGGMKRTGPKPRSDIDLHLAIACVLQADPKYTPAHCWGTSEIAAFCGCHHSLIQQTEKSALEKLRRRVKLLSQ